MTVKDYLLRPYTKVVRRDDDGQFVARVQELPGCVAHGDSERAALRRLAEAQELWIQDALEAGHSIPAPLPDDTDLPSGRWLQRVPRTLHARLSDLARREGVSLNQFVTSVLSEAVGKHDQREEEQPPGDEALSKSWTALLHFSRAWDLDAGSRVLVKDLTDCVIRNQIDENEDEQHAYWAKSQQAL